MESVIKKIKMDEPKVIARSDHSVSRSNISKNAIKVLKRLHNAGFQSYLVGGGVRDLLLGLEPKDFDVVTDAHPEQIKKLFRNGRIIGRRFLLVHVNFGSEVIEVATFRTSLDAAESDMEMKNGRIISDNVYGTIDNDAWRRDFTINALYYNISDFSVLDYMGGIEDLNRGMLRLIGDPEQRYREDPVRMLRAVRLSVKLGFKVHEDTGQPIFELKSLLESIPPARLFEEVIKMFLKGKALQTFEKLRHYGLFEVLFPLTDARLQEEENNFPNIFVCNALNNTDKRVSFNKPVTPSFLYAALLWPALKHQVDLFMPQVEYENEALQKGIGYVLTEQNKRIIIPKRFSQVMRDVWFLQYQFEFIQGKRPFRLLQKRFFRAAYDLFELRVMSGEGDQVKLEWWTRFQEVDLKEQQEMSKLNSKPGKKKRNKLPAIEDNTASN